MSNTMRGLIALSKVELEASHIQRLANVLVRLDPTDAMEAWELFNDSENLSNVVALNKAISDTGVKISDFIADLSQKPEVIGDYHLKELERQVGIRQIRPK